MAKKIIIAIVAVLACAGLIYAGNRILTRAEEANDTNVAYVTSVATLTGVNSGMQNRFSGVVEAQETWDIQLNQDRTVKELLVERGQHVEVGTALFIYDVESFRADLSQANLDMERIDTNIFNLTKQKEQLEAEKLKAKEDEQFDYTMQIQSTEMQIKQTEYEKVSKEVTIQNIQQSIENATVYSQLAGVVKSINTTGSYNNSGQLEPYISILASGDLQIKGSVNEQNLSEIMIGMPVLLHSRVDDSVWRGVIHKLDTDNPNMNDSNMYYGGGGGQSSTTYPFYITLDSSAGLNMGQHVYIEMDYGQGEVKEGLWLNEFYIAWDEETPYVWARNTDGKLEKRIITLGAYDEDMYEYEVVAGLSLEDNIAMPDEYLEEGMKTEIGEMGMMGTMEMMDFEWPEDGFEVEQGDIIIEGGEVEIKMEDAR